MPFSDDAYDGFISHLFMSDEAHFHPSGYVNKRKYGYWIAENPTIYGIIKYVFLVAFVSVIMQLIRRILRKQVTDTAARYKSQKGIEIIAPKYHYLGNFDEMKSNIITTFLLIRFK